MVPSTAVLTQLHAWCPHMQPPPLQGYQQHAQTIPRVEEVPLDAAGSGTAGAAAGPIVEEPGWFETMCERGCASSVMYCGASSALTLAVVLSCRRCWSCKQWWRRTTAALQQPAARLPQHTAPAAAAAPAGPVWHAADDALWRPFWWDVRQHDGRHAGCWCWHGRACRTGPAGVQLQQQHSHEVRPRRHLPQLHHQQAGAWRGRCLSQTPSMWRCVNFSDLCSDILPHAQSCRQPPTQVRRRAVRTNIRVRLLRSHTCRYARRRRPSVMGALAWSR